MSNSRLGLSLASAGARRRWQWRNRSAAVVRRTPIADGFSGQADRPAAVGRGFGLQEASGAERRALSTADAAAANADRAIRLSAYGFCSSIKPIAHREIGQLNAGSRQLNAGFCECWPTQHRSWPIQRGFRPIQRGLPGHGSRVRRPTLCPDKQRQNAETTPASMCPLARMSRSTQRGSWPIQRGCRPIERGLAPRRRGPKLVATFPYKTLEKARSTKMWRRTRFIGDLVNSTRV